MSESDNSDYDPIPDNEEIEENDTPPDEGEAAVLADIWGAPGGGKDHQQEDEGTEEQTDGRDLFSPTNGATSALELMRVKSSEQANPEKDEEDDEDEQNTPEEVEKDNAEDTGEPQAKRAARQGLTRLPLSRIKTMLKNFDPEWKGQSADAAIALILVIFCSFMAVFNAFLGRRTVH